MTEDRTIIRAKTEPPPLAASPGCVLEQRSPVLQGSDPASELIERANARAACPGL